MNISLKLLWIKLEHVDILKRIYILENILRMKKNRKKYFMFHLNLICNLNIVIRFYSIENLCDSINLRIERNYFSCLCRM